MKKKGLFVSLLLCATLIFAMTTVAVSAEEEKTGGFTFGAAASLWMPQSGSS